MVPEYWIGPSVNVAAMTDNPGVDTMTVMDLIGTAFRDELLSLSPGQSLFIVGGRKSILKDLMFRLSHFYVKTNSGNVAIAVKHCHYMFHKDKRVVQIHGLGDVQGGSLPFPADTIMFSTIRDNLQFRIWKIRSV